MGEDDFTKNTYVSLNYHIKHIRLEFAHIPTWKSWRCIDEISYQKRIIAQRHVYITNTFCQA